MRLGLALVAVGATLGLAAPADATVGGPVSVEVLGFDPRDASVYYLELDGSEAYAPPTLFRLPIGGPWPRTAETVAWERAYVDAGAWEERWRAEEPRFGGIHDRLVPLIALPANDVEVELECPRTGDARGRLRGPSIVPRPIRLDLVRGCEAQVRTVAIVPGTTDAIAVVRYLGIPVESGYDRERVVLVRYRAPPTRTTAPSPVEVRARLEAVYQGGDETPARLDLVVLGATGRTSAVTVARSPGDCFVEASPFRVRCARTGELRVVHHAHTVDVVRDGHVIARAPLPPGFAPTPAFAVATETLLVAEPDVRAICATDWDCRLVVDGATVLFEPMRGRLECSAEGSRLRCAWSHTTRIDMIHDWCIDVPRRRAVRC